ncbi:VCBS repeat-containing protein [Ferruginibacter paludis]|uniref:VCBS repeat-containing protein n=1 Tax=Ferruginibacter paludis TaxID=1310417 RepID=UPI0025B38703|nr:VCBS repeat-containing protein [Ferruginibacter paludis]MDN3657316.1 VCBS repeat-containing protein [Ferruginibacter paludis]
MRFNITTATLLLLFAIPAIAQQKLFQLLPPGQTNIHFSNDISESESLNVLSYEYFYNGGGVAVGDINNDGLPDLFFTGNMKANKLYLNLGNMQFKDITKDACSELPGRAGGWKTGVTMADVNGDGLMDIYVCYSGKVGEELRRNQLFINKGNLKFTEEAKAYGLDDKSYSTQAAFFDYDNDGDLDMFLLNHSTKKIDNMEFAKFRNDIDELAGDKLYENNGNHFTDVSVRAGIRQNPMTFGLGIAIADVNKDGWQDIYVSNDYNEPDYLYINNHDGTFTDQSQQRLRHLSQFSMGVDIADFNNDGLPDIMSLDMLPEDNRRQKLLQLQENYESFALMQSQDLYKQYMRNMLQLNNGDGTFSEIGRLAGVSATDWSWCPLFADFDNDGFKDLFISNGYLRDYTNKDFLRYWGDYKVKKAVDREPALLMDLVKAMPSTTLPNYIFKNNHDLTFSNKQIDWGLSTPGISSGAVYADLDNDGDLDLVINNINEVASVYKNQSREQDAGNYVAVKLSGRAGNTNAIGAKVYLYTNGNMQYQEVNPNRGYLSCISTVLNFGLGTQKNIDSLKIIWPDGSTQLTANLTVNQKIIIQQKDVPQPVKTAPENAVKPLFTKSSALLDYKSEVSNQNDFKRQLLMLFMYSKTGPVIARADVNKDGLEDMFISGDNTQAAKIYIQQRDGHFVAQEGFSGGNENECTVAAAVFFDANGDGFPDLYIAKGGYSLWEANTHSLQDELYLNDGKGNFSLSEEALPDVSASSKSCVRPCDIDGDGDLDLFVGGRIIPGKYPLAPKSYLLINDGKGKFTVADMPFSNIGMVTDAQWIDINKDGRKDLVLCGELMPIKIFINTTSGFADKTGEYFSEPTNGFWFTLNIADVDGDGNEDLIAGNLGLNSPFKISEKEPAEMYYADFDGNGSIDPFFNCYVQGKSYPFVSRDELNEQIYPMRRKFSSYKNYADAGMKEIFTPDELAKASVLTASEERTVCFLNRGGKFVKSLLPLQAQFSVVTKILAKDFTHDGKIDLLLLGNHADNRLKIGSIDANYGCLLEGDGKGNFEYIPQPVSGFSVKGDVKSAEAITVGKEQYIVIGIAGSELIFYKQN